MSKILSTLEDYDFDDPVDALNFLSSVPEDDSLPVSLRLPVLETPNTDNCAEGSEKSVKKPIWSDEQLWRGDVAGVMRWQGRYKDAERFENCGKFIVDYCSCGYRTVGIKRRMFRCGLRECPDCARMEAGRLYRRIIDEMKLVTPIPGWRWRHVIFTSVRDSRNTLKTDMREVKSGIKRLRAYFRRREFSRGISAVGGIEFGPKNGMVHVHLMIFAPYLKKREIEGIWKLGFIRIKLIESARQIENVTFYCIDFSKRGKFKDPVYLGNCGWAMKGYRRVFTWGGLYGKIKREKPVKQERKCPVCGEVMSWEYAVPELKTGPPVYS